VGQRRECFRQVRGGPRRVEIARGGGALKSDVQRAAVVVVLAFGFVLAPLDAAHAGPHRKPPAVNVSGDYSSTYETVHLHQHGRMIEGDYVCCGGGTIDGVIAGKVIHYHWAGADGTEGNGVWTVVGVGTLRGTWGTGESEDDGGEWNLDRVDDATTIAN
jgi:hypothetical protein